MMTCQNLPTRRIGNWSLHGKRFPICRPFPPTLNTIDQSKTAYAFEAYSSRLRHEFRTHYIRRKSHNSPNAVTVIMWNLEHRKMYKSGAVIPNWGYVQWHRIQIRITNCKRPHHSSPDSIMHSILMHHIMIAFLTNDYNYCTICTCGASFTKLFEARSREPRIRVN